MVKNYVFVEDSAFVNNLEDKRASLALSIKIGLKSPAMEKTKSSSSTPLPADIVKLSFEDALAELEKLVKRLEDGKAKLEDAIDAYERGAQLKQHCESKLREAKIKIEQITIGSDGKVSTVPFNS